MNGQQETRKFLRWARSIGWIVTKTRKNHYRLVWPPTGAFLFAGGTISDVNAFRMVRSRMKAIMERRPISSTTQEKRGPL